MATTSCKKIFEKEKRVLKKWKNTEKKSNGKKDHKGGYCYFNCKRYEKKEEKLMRKHLKRSRTSKRSKTSKKYKK